MRDFPFVPWHLFGPNVPELLEKRVKLSEATRQLTQVQRNPTFRMPAVQTRHHYATPEQRFRRHTTPQSQPPQRPCVPEDARVFRHIIDSFQEDPVSAARFMLPIGSMFLHGVGNGA